MYSAGKPANKSQVRKGGIKMEKEEKARCKEISGNLKATIQNLMYPFAINLPDSYKTLSDGPTEGAGQVSILEMKDKHLKHVDITRERHTKHDQ